jgi:hypothetical protein
LYILPGIDVLLFSEPGESLWRYNPLHTSGCKCILLQVYGRRHECLLRQYPSRIKIYLLWLILVRWLFLQINLILRIFYVWTIHSYLWILAAVYCNVGGTEAMLDSVVVPVSNHRGVARDGSLYADLNPPGVDFSWVNDSIINPR